MKRHLLKIAIVLTLIFCHVAGCMKLALRFSPSLIPQITGTFFEECDVDLARESLPSQLKILEGLLKNDPDNRQILTALCAGFTGYAMLFIEEKDPLRASQLYLRAREYGFRALGSRGLAVDRSIKKKQTFEDVLSALDEDDMESLFWTTMTWNLWLNLNLDKPVALAQLSMAEASLRRVLEIDPNYLFGAPHILLGSFLSAKPGLLGGDPSGAKDHFEKALALSDGKFLLCQYLFASTYAVRVQDKELFLQLLDQIKETPADGLKEVCLINAVAKQKAEILRKIADDLFI